MRRRRRRQPTKTTTTTTMMMLELFTAFVLVIAGWTLPQGSISLSIYRHRYRYMYSRDRRRCRSSYSTIALSSSPSSFTFEELSRLDDRLSTLQDEACGGNTAADAAVGGDGFLMDYYDPVLNSFSILPGGKTTNVSITSTAYAVRCLLDLHQQDQQDPSSSSSSLPSPSLLLTPSSSRSKMVQTLLRSNWRSNDLYQVSLILIVVLRLDPTLECLKKKKNRKTDMKDSDHSHDDDGTTDGTSVDDDRVKVAQLILLVLSGRPERRRGERQRFSSYIQYLCATVYGDLMRMVTANTSSIIDELIDDQLLEPTVKRDINLAVFRSAEISNMEFCRQLAYRSSGDSALFDVIKMIYSMLTYVKSTRAIRDVTTSGSTNNGVELLNISNDIYDGDNDDDDETKSANADVSTSSTSESSSPGEFMTMSQENPKLVQAGLQAFFEEQNADDGLWDRGQPIYKSFRRQGRNIGNAYVFGVDALGSLLTLLDAGQFRPYLSNIERTLTWMEGNVRTEIVPDYCDPYTGKCYGKVLRGWTSSHLLASPSNGPKAWSTAQALSCLSRMRHVVREILHDDVLSEFGGRPLSTKGPSDIAWNRLLDSDIGSSSGDVGQDHQSITTIKAVLEDRVTTPFANGASTPSAGAAYSTILFGSPGTAKTTITEAVADKLGWDFLTIDTAVFLEDGLGNVASRIRYVFRRLETLRNCVILFDEIEEFCLDRETPGISMESRMLTTAMLTAINDLRRKKQSIFFLATNRLRAFDAAIIRPGRFDMQLFVGTPNLQSRVTLLEQSLSSTGSDLSPSVKEETIETYKSFLEDVWTQDAMFFNYLEGKQFAASVAAIVTASGSAVVRDDLQRLLSQQASVMTARGPVRDEYIAQMNLSRF